MQTKWIKNGSSDEGILAGLLRSAPHYISNTAANSIDLHISPIICIAVMYFSCMFCILYLNCNTLTPQDADVLKPGKTIWYLEHVPSKMQCFTHTVRRYHHHAFPKNITFYFLHQVLPGGKPDKNSTGCHYRTTQVSQP